MLEMWAFQIFHGGNSIFINSFDKTKIFMGWRKAGKNSVDSLDFLGVNLFYAFD